MDQAVPDEDTVLAGKLNAAPEWQAGCLWWRSKKIVGALST
jgi:hypothetical protein